MKETGAVHLRSLIQLPDPYPLLARLREAGPVCPLHSEGPTHSWIVSGHAEVVDALRDHRLSSDPSTDIGAHDERLDSHVSRTVFARSLFTSDPPDHTRLRRAITQLLTPRKVGALRPFIERTASSLIDGLANDGADAVDDFGAPLTMLTMCRLLGIPGREHRSLVRWSNELTTEQVDDASRRRSQAGGQALAACLADLLAEQGGQPAAGLVSSLVTAPAGNRLADDEIVTMATLLLVAGHETTIGLISNAIRCLLCDPSTAHAVRRRPDAVPGALEEILRYDGPVIMTVRRIATADIRLGHRTIHAGDHVILCLASANRDERRFPAADELVIDRHPNPHLSFGHGIHRCPGAALALLEARIAVDLLIRRTRRLALAVPVDELRWRPGKVRCLAHLPIRASF